MSANLVIDLQNTTLSVVSITDPPILSGGTVCVGSGTIIGTSCDLINANTLCNIAIAGNTQSGQLRIQVQSSDTDVSGNYTDPTSGLPILPGVFQSGGIIWLNSGGAGGGLFGAQTSGYSIASGFQQFTAFQRPGRFVRANVLSEGSAQYCGQLNVAFVSQLKYTGSGGGFSLLPTSGAVNV